MATNGRNGNGNEGYRRRARRNLRTRAAGVKRSAAPRPGMPRWMYALLAVGALGVIAMMVAAAAAIIVYRSYADDLVAPDELAINQPSYGAKIYDRNGKLLYEYVDDKSGLRRPIKIENVSEAFLAATIATEDDNFYSNPGVNIRGLVRAAWENSPFQSVDGVIGGGSGGSSITQQLVKNVYIPEAERQERSLTRKLKETVFALELTQRYDKEKILEWYVNQISYGGVYNGVEAAAQGYFGKSAADLTLAEAALLAGIPQSPAAYDPVNNPEAATERRNIIIDLLASHGSIRIGEDKYYETNAEALASARQEEIHIAEKRFPIEAPHFVLQYVQPQIELIAGADALYRDGLEVTTTLDIDLQNETAAIMENRIREFETISGSRNGSMMVMDPRKGEILVMLGSRDYFNEDIEGKNNNATSCNSPGSSFKPFAFLATFVDLGWGPGTMILDTPVSYNQGPGLPAFVPDNPLHNFSGPVTIRYALGNSLNIPAVKAAAAVGPDKVVAQARKVGFMKTFREGENGCSGGGYGPAIATGGVGVTLEEMMFGYTTLANGGILRGAAPLNPQGRRSNERTIDPISILKVTDAQGRVRYDVEEKRKEERVVKEEYTYMISNVLSDSSAQCATFGCGGISVPGLQVAVKTGTSEPFSADGPNKGKIGETWAFGYTPDFVVGIWAGNSDNSPIINIFSTSISFRAMRDTMQTAYGNRGSTPFPRPANVVDESVCVPSGLKPTPLCGKTTKDLFVKDTLPTKEDDWWQRVRIDQRNGQLAGPGTPPQYVEEKIMLVPPADLLKTDEDKKRMQEWSDSLGLPLAPTETSNITGGNPGSDLPVAIFSPVPGSNVSGVVQISGRATSPRLDNYRVEFGSGTSPTSWKPITRNTRAVESGTIGIWDAKDVEPGIYTIRLVVEDRGGSQVTATVIVNVNTQGAATPTPTPRPALRP